MITKSDSLTILGSILFFIAPLPGSVLITVGTAGWGDADSSDGPDDGLVWGFVVDTTRQTFESTAARDLATALVGFNVPDYSDPFVPILIRETTYAFVRGSTNSRTGPPPSFQPGYFDAARFTLENGVSSGDAIGLLWFEAGTSAVQTSQAFGFAPLASTVPNEGASPTTGFGGSPTTMQYQTVPEPGLLGLTGLAALGLLRRRRR